MINKEIKICILGGGWSNEREISLKSSNDVYSCLKKNNHNVVYYDMVCDSAPELETSFELFSEISLSLDQPPPSMQILISLLIILLK